MPFFALRAPCAAPAKKFSGTEPRAEFTPHKHTTAHTDTIPLWLLHCENGTGASSIPYHCWGELGTNSLASHHRFVCSSTYPMPIEVSDSNHPPWELFTLLRYAPDDVIGFHGCFLSGRPFAQPRIHLLRSAQPSSRLRVRGLGRCQKCSLAS